jgi:hypothetical protein
MSERFPTRTKSLSLDGQQKGKVGRPAKFNSVAELQSKVEAYFKKCDQEHEPYTVTGLALALGTTRRTLVDYENDDEFSHTIKMAKTLCENYLERKALKGDIPPAVGIFMLKNFGWTDKTYPIPEELPRRVTIAIVNEDDY